MVLERCIPDPGLGNPAIGVAGAALVVAVARENESRPPTVGARGRAGLEPRAPRR